MEAVISLVLLYLPPGLHHPPSAWGITHQLCFRHFSDTSDLTQKHPFLLSRYLVSSLNHWNSAMGTAEASQLKMPFWPTETPVFLALEI